MNPVQCIWVGIEDKSLAYLESVLRMRGMTLPREGGTDLWEDIPRPPLYETDLLDCHNVHVHVVATVALYSTRDNIAPPCLLLFISYPYPGLSNRKARSGLD